MDRRIFLKAMALCLVYPSNILSNQLTPNKEELIIIDGAMQKLFLGNLIEGKFIANKDYEISTSKYGFGNISRSEKTPLGLHQIKRKIGGNHPIGKIFRYEMSMGRIYSSKNGKPLITSRILVLDGLEKFNKNTLSREIYIHGTNLESLVGVPVSDGCIRMRNKDVIELYDLVSIGTKINILAS